MYSSHEVVETCSNKHSDRIVAKKILFLLQMLFVPNVYIRKTICLLTNVGWFEQELLRIAKVGRSPYIWLGISFAFICICCSPKNNACQLKHFRSLKPMACLLKYFVYFWFRKHWKIENIDYLHYEPLFEIWLNNKTSFMTAARLMLYATYWNNTQQTLEITRKFKETLVNASKS